MHVAVVPPADAVPAAHWVHVPELDVKRFPPLHDVHFPFVLSHALQVDEQAVQVVAVPPAEYVIAAQA